MVVSKGSIEFLAQTIMTHFTNDVLGVNNVLFKFKYIVIQTNHKHKTNI